MREPHQLQALRYALGARGAEGDVGLHREVGEERPVLEHHPDPAVLGLHPGPVARDGPAGDRDPSRVRRLEARDHPQQRGLAGAAGPEQRDERALVNRDGRVVDGTGRAERFDDADGVDGSDRAWHEADKVTLMAARWSVKRLGIIAGAVMLVIALLAVAAFALGGSADVVVYNGRSQYGDEQAFKALRGADRPGRRAARRHRARALRAAAP